MKNLFTKQILLLLIFFQANHLLFASQSSVTETAAEKTIAVGILHSLSGQSFNAPSGYQIAMDKNNHHLHKPVFVGQIQKDGRVLPAEPWSHYIKDGE